MIVNYAEYKDSAPGADGFEVKRQNLTWVLPVPPRRGKSAAGSGPNTTVAFSI